MSAAPVYDALSNRNEHIVEAVKAIGRYGGLKCKVFEAVYYHKKRVKSVAELVAMTGLTRMQVLQSAGALKKAGIMGQTRKAGDTAYEQIESFQHAKVQIIALLKVPSKLKDFATKRTPIVRGQSVSFVRPKGRVPAEDAGKRQRRPSQPLLRIAFLATNPDRYASLRTDIEVRDVVEAVKSAKHGHDVEVRHLPASTIETLIDTLNEYRPHILHFSGHAGGEALLFDRKSPGFEGGVVLDFDLVASVIASARPRPRVLVLSACDTVRGAERFLEEVEAVVAMAASIDDAAACHFSRRFYKSLASGASLESALSQAKLVLKADEYKDFELPTLLPEHGEARTMCFFSSE